MGTADHEKLDVYQRALRVAEGLELAALSAPRGRADIREQLRSASLSIPLNIAEGAGTFAPLEKARFYGYARRSATECMSVLDVLRRLTRDDARYRSLQDDLRIVAGSLTSLILAMERRAQAERQESPAPSPSPRPHTSDPASGP